MDGVEVPAARRPNACSGEEPWRVRSPPDPARADVAFDPFDLGECTSGGPPLASAVFADDDGTDIEVDRQRHRLVRRSVDRRRFHGPVSTIAGP